jgi:hypothetical protein
VDALSRLDIDSLKIQEDKVLTLLSGSENNSIKNIKLKILMHNALKIRSIEKIFTQPHYSIQHIEGYDLLYYNEN